MGRAVLLGAEGKAYEIAAKVFEENGQFAVDFIGLPGSECLGGDGSFTELELYRSQVSAISGDMEGDEVGGEGERGRAVDGCHAGNFKF